MTDDSRESMQEILTEIRTMLANKDILRKKLEGLRSLFKRQLRDGSITRFRYDVELHDSSRLQRTVDAQWVRLQQQRSRVLEKLCPLA